MVAATVSYAPEHADWPVPSWTRGSRPRAVAAVSSSSPPQAAKLSGDRLTLCASRGYAGGDMSVNFRYDEDKFRELILYIAHKCSDDRGFGDTRLNKVLFFSDAFALQYLGEPVTGARYQKLPYGPAPRALLPVRRAMEAEGDLRTERVGDPPRTVTMALRGPDMSHFSEAEMELIDEVIGIFEGKTAALVSRLSHLNSPGWNLVETHEDIPLESQLLSTSSPPPEVLERGRELAQRFGW
jgi:Protein of unknown function (DUF4065)